MQASNQLASEVNKVTDFLEESREKKKVNEEAVRNLQVQLRAGQKRMVEVKKCYENKCREEIQANHQYHQEVSRSGRDSSVAERASRAHAKVVSGLEQSEEVYRQAVEALEEIRGLWKTETETCLDLFQDISSSRLRLLRDTAWVVSNIGSATCVKDDGVYEESRQVLETAYSEVGKVVEEWIKSNQTGEEVPGEVVCQWSATSSTLGMGHMKSQQQLSYDTASLGRCEMSLSSPHLTDLGRSRSDLVRHQPPPPALMSPKKPPRMFQYNPSPAARNNQITPDRSSHLSPDRTSHLSPDRTSHLSPDRTSHLSPDRTSHLSPDSKMLGGIDNGEYYSVSSSDYNSDLSLSDQSSPRGRPTNRQLRTQDSRQRFSVDRAGAGYRQAVVTCQYKRKHYSEVSSSTLDSQRVFLL